METVRLIKGKQNTKMKREKVDDSQLYMISTWKQRLYIGYIVSVLYIGYIVSLDEVEIHLTYHL